MIRIRRCDDFQWLRYWRRLVPALTAVFPLVAGECKAGVINIPNFSFESPGTTFVDTHIDSWQEAAKPDWYPEGGGFTWDQLTGVFKNTDITSSDHIDNCDGHQAMWVFAVPEVAVFQDYDSIDWNHSTPTH